MSETRHSFSHEAMTTLFEVIVEGQEQEYARQASTAVFRELDRVEKLLNKWDAGSDIGQINLLEPGQTVRVAIETLECLDKAVWAYQRTDGLFDPTVGTGFERLDIDRARFSVGWKSDGKGQLDLGGIAKGYAIDRAAEVLADWDVTKALINGGTSTVLALGRDWALGIGGPWGEEAGLTEVTLNQQALSGSGTEVKGAHIINPKTGKSAQRHLAAWAIHSAAAVSDALSTAFMMMGEEMVRNLCRDEPAVRAVMVRPDESLIRIGV